MFKTLADSVKLYFISNPKFEAGLKKFSEKAFKEFNCEEDLGKASKGLKEFVKNSKLDNPLNLVERLNSFLTKRMIKKLPTAE